MEAQGLHVTGELSLLGASLEPPYGRNKEGPLVPGHVGECTALAGPGDKPELYLHAPVKGACSVGSDTSEIAAREADAHLQALGREHGPLWEGLLSPPAWRRTVTGAQQHALAQRGPGDSTVLTSVEDGFPPLLPAARSS